MNAIMRGSGKPVALDLAHVFTIRDGRIAALREYSDSALLTAAYKG